MYETMEFEDEQFLFDEAEGEQFLFDEAEGEQFLFDEAEGEQFLGDVLKSVAKAALPAAGSALSSALNNALGGEVTGPLSEQTEMELAGELLEVGSEQELEQFLGGLIKSAAKGVSNFARSSTGRALGGILKNVAKTALPAVGGALGSMVAPGVGTAIGSKLGSLAGGLLELEGEVGEQELEFEMARRVVRIGHTAARQAAHHSGSAAPATVARRAVVQATRRHAPAVLVRYAGEPTHHRYRHRRPARAPMRYTGAPSTGPHNIGSHNIGWGIPSAPVGVPVARRGYAVEPLAEPWVQRPSGYRTPAASNGITYSAAPSGRWIRRGDRIIVIGA